MNRGVVAIAALAAVALGVVGYALRPQPTVVVVGSEPATDAGIEPWCADGLIPIEGGGCFAAPAELTAPVPLLVYLHGR